VRLLESVAQVASSTESLVAHADAAATSWATRADQVRGEEERALHAVADLAQASARTGEHVAALSETVGRTAEALDPDVRIAARSAARTLEHVEAITGRIAATDVASSTSAVMWALLGAAVALVAVGGSVGVRALFRREVARVAARVAPGSAPP
jgi:hypothetical protein